MTLPPEQACLQLCHSNLVCVAQDARLQDTSRIVPQENAPAVALQSTIIDECTAFPCKSKEWWASKLRLHSRTTPTLSSHARECCGVPNAARVCHRPKRTAEVHPRPFVPAHGAPVKLDRGTVHRHHALMAVLLLRLRGGVALAVSTVAVWSCFERREND